MGVGEMDEIVNTIEAERKFIDKNNIISVKAFKIKNDKDSTLILSKIYDQNGNLTESIDYHFTKDENYEHRYFFYDSLNKRLEEYSELSFTENFKSNYIKYYYDSTERIISIEKGIGFENIKFHPQQSLKIYYDSIRVIENIDGSVNSKTYFDYLESNKNPRLLIETHKYKYSEEGVLEFEEVYLNGKLWQKRAYDSFGNNIESIYFKTNRRNKKIEFHDKSLYDERGVQMQLLRLGKNGKIKNRKMFYYQYR